MSMGVQFGKTLTSSQARVKRAGALALPTCVCRFGERALIAARPSLPTMCWRSWRPRADQRPYAGTLTYSRRRTGQRRSTAVTSDERRVTRIPSFRPGETLVQRGGLLCRAGGNRCPATGGARGGDRRSLRRLWADYPAPYQCSTE